MKNIKKIVFTVVFIGFVLSCSTKKDTLINRNYHALTTKYNVLFNGKEAFKKGLKAINDTYEDDFFKQLPIEPLEFTEEKIELAKYDTGGFSGFDDRAKQETPKALSPFEKAEQKAVKAIQKHSMNIAGKERNSQIDEAYMLLGKTRYYSQRYVPAVEAFNYIIVNYPNASLINEAKFWRAKANIRLENERFAIETLRYLLTIRDTLEVDLQKNPKEKGYTALAMAYVQTDSIQKAKEALIKATSTTKDKYQATRNMFVLGQIYASENKKDSARSAFQRIIDFKRAPHKYKIHAQIEIAKNFPKDSSPVALIKTFKKLIKNRDNRKYLDALHYQLGVLQENNDSTRLAIQSYNTSLRIKNGKEQQKSYAYESLGNLYFKNESFQLASAYYDSILQLPNDSTSLRIRRVKRKFKNLASLIHHENIVKSHDSILALAAMPTTAQASFFEEHIKKLKKQDQEEAQRKMNKLAFGGTSTSSLQSANKGKWYFYNGQSLSFGQDQFKKKWGNRALDDNWRWSITQTVKEEDLTNPDNKIVGKRYDLQSYLQAIPTKKEEIDSLRTKRNQSLFELGLIYKQQFVNLPLSAEKLERLLTLNPSEFKLLPIYYNLYKIYVETNNSPKATYYKNKILEDYADSKYAQFIISPNQKISDKTSLSETEKTYKKLYYLYKENKFEEVVEKIDTLLPELQNSILIPKFELLKAYAIGKYQDKEVYKKAMENVAVSYASSEQGKKARQIVEQLTK